MKQRPQGRRRRSVRRQFTALYTALFLGSGAVMLAAVALVTGGTVDAAPAPGNGPDPDPAHRIAVLQQQLAAARHDLTRQLLIGSAVGLAVMGAVSLLIGWYAAGRVLRPLRAMTAATRRISADNLHERLAVDGPHDELRDLGDTVDDLLTRLEGAFTAQRRFVADASHELRTPLATMRTAVDVTLAKPGPLAPQTRQLADRIGPELDRIEKLLDGLLALARAQHGVLPGNDTVRLDELAATALADHAGAIAARRLTATHDGARRARGSRTLLARLVDNLVANAVRHNEPGGWLHVTATPAGLVVENGGALLTDDQMADLTRPFHRLGPERTGTGEGSGLGLAIAGAVAEAHGGTLALHPRPEGGLRVTVTLPPAEESTP